MDFLSGARCPCGTGLTYGECCEPFHRGTALPPTAERLMRSRYTAYATQNRDYLLRTWHRSTRPKALTLDPEIEWIRLEILGRTGGGMLDIDGTVDFRATFRSDGVRQDQSENSRFVKQGKSWLYVDEV